MDKEMIMKVLKSEIIAKLEEWSPEDFAGCAEVWHESQSADVTFHDFCMRVAAQNVLFDKIEEES